MQLRPLALVALAIGGTVLVPASAPWAAGRAIDETQTPIPQAAPGSIEAAPALTPNITTPRIVTPRIEARTDGAPPIAGQSLVINPLAVRPLIVADVQRELLRLQRTAESTRG